MIIKLYFSIGKRILEIIPDTIICFDIIFSVGGLADIVL